MENPCLFRKYHQNGAFSMAMLVYRSATPFKYSHSWYLYFPFWDGISFQVSNSNKTRQADMNHEILIGS